VFRSRFDTGASLNGDLGKPIRNACYLCTVRRLPGPVPAGRGEVRRVHTGIVHRGRPRGVVAEAAGRRVFAAPGAGPSPRTADVVFRRQGRAPARRRLLRDSVSFRPTISPENAYVDVFRILRAADNFPSRCELLKITDIRGVEQRDFHSENFLLTIFNNLTFFSPSRLIHPMFPLSEIMLEILFLQCL